MNYKSCYDRLIERSKLRGLTGYVEKHHIVPKCMGGSNDKSNIAVLTPEEHYLAHQLLVRIYPSNRKLIWAMSAMTNGTKSTVRNNKMYGWVRREFAKMIGNMSRGRKSSAETRAKQSAARKGKKTGPYNRKPAGTFTAAKGVAKSTAHKKSLSAAKLGKKRKPFSEETKRKISESNKIASAKRDFSLFKTDEYRNMQSAQMKRVWKERQEKQLIKD